ncbi:MAG: acyl-CoA thioesterase [Gammaproteobacteria bacterium]
MAVVWHGHYLRYFEEARVALMRRIGYDYPDMQASGYTWPVIEVHLRYARAAHYAQRLAVTAELLEWENRLRVGYLIADAASGERLTSGYTIQCAVNDAGELQLVSPSALLERLAPFLR